MLKKLIVATLSTIVVGAVGASAYSAVVTPLAQPEAVAVSASIDDASQIQPDTCQGKGPAWSNSDESTALETQGQAGQSMQGRVAGQNRGQQNQAAGQNVGQQGQAQESQGQGQWRGGRGGGGRWASDNSYGDATGVPEPQNGLTEWLSFHGTVSDFAPPSLTLLTDDGQYLVVELGNSNYVQNLGLGLEIGAGVSGIGFYDTNGGLTVGQITIDTTGETFALRDEMGRPLWAGGQNH
jgi:hypothetical protein